MKRISLVDLKAQHETLRPQIDEAIAAVIGDTAFIGTKNNRYVEKFERDFAASIGAEHCVACGNGTDAIEIALAALGVGPGDEVLVPALTWISTAEAVTTVGATPVFVDIDRNSYTIDTNAIEEKITGKTKAIIPVHLYGLPADMDTITAIAKRHDLLVIEDCAQAHGTEYKGKKVGTFGNAGTFSFFPGKNLGAYGDAGGIVTNDANVERECRLISQHGQVQKNEHLREGRNSRMDGIQAAVLSVKLPHLPRWIEARRAVAALYGRLLKDSAIGLPTEPAYAKHAYHLYVIEVDTRDAVKKKLQEAGIECGVHYPVALPFLTPYLKFGHRESDFPNAVAATARILSLPIYPELTEKDVAYVASALLEKRS